MAKKPTAVSALDLDLGFSLPGEQLVVKILDIILEAMRGQPAEVKAQMWSWVVRDVRRWRRFWKMDGDDALLLEQSEAAAGIRARVQQAQAGGVTLTAVEFDVDFIEEVAKLLEGDSLPAAPPPSE